MKTIRSKFLFRSLGLALLLPLTSQAAVIYQDDFAGTAGSLLNGRSPNVTNTTGNTYTATSTLEVNGSGRAVITSGSGFASIALPTINLSDTITITASIRPQNNASSDNWIGLGFGSSAAAMTTSGTAWAILRGGFTHANQGRVSIFSGNNTAGQVYGSSAQEPTWGGSSPSTMTLTYVVGTGNLTVALGAATLFDGIIDYGGVADTAAPLSALSQFTIQWNNQDVSTNPTPGFVDSYSLEIIPEPSSFALLAGGLVALVALRRRRR